jgi:hypothetical protein
MVTSAAIGQLMLYAEPVGGLAWWVVGGWVMLEVAYPGGFDHGEMKPGVALSL